MKRAILALLAVLALTGCDGQAPPASPDKPATGKYSGSRFSEIRVELSDGRSVLCLKDDGGYSAISCDWNHAK